jgi:hypothetical protein
MKTGIIGSFLLVGLVSSQTNHQHLTTGNVLFYLWHLPLTFLVDCADECMAAIGHNALTPELCHDMTTQNVGLFHHAFTSVY